MRTPANRGTTLLEVMVALTILLVGLLAMMQGQIFGMTSDQGARANTRAVAIAEDLIAALERTQYNDATYLSQDVASSVAPPPSPAVFGSLLSGAGKFHDEVTIGSVPPGAIPTCLNSPTTPGCVETDPQNPTQPLYYRRWVVWWYTPPGAKSDPSGQPPVKMISVSVIYHERTLQAPREVVLYDQRYNVNSMIAIGGS